MRRMECGWILKRLKIGIMNWGTLENKSNSSAFMSSGARLTHIQTKGFIGYFTSTRKNGNQLVCFRGDLGHRKNKRVTNKCLDSRFDLLSAFLLLVRTVTIGYL